LPDMNFWIYLYDDIGVEAVRETIEDYDEDVQ
jgi:hypothetical protein